MDHKTLISALGGPHRLHDLLLQHGVAVEQVTVRSWALPGRSIPAKYWLHVKTIADEIGVEASFEDMAKAIASPLDDETAQPEQEAA